MKRRTLLRRMGATGVAAAAFAGTTTAEAADPSLGIDHEIDVADVSGRVTLAELLEPRDLDRLSEDVDPGEEVIEVATMADSIVLQDCCVYCSEWLNVCDCPGGCCRLSRCACPGEYC